MEWTPILVTHVLSALLAVSLGPVNILRRRRDRTHRTLGFVWTASMYYTCVSSFWIVSEGHFTWLHGLAAFTIVTVTLGIAAAVKGDRRAHRANMIGSYIGIVIAFGFAAVAPGRAIPLLVASSPLVAGVVVVLVAMTTAALYLGVRNRAKAFTPHKLLP